MHGAVEVDKETTCQKTDSHQSTHPDWSQDIPGVVTGQDAPRRGYGGLPVSGYGGLPVSEEGRKSKRDTARPGRGLSPQLRRCEAPHMGLAAADSKGQAAEGAVWVKMNVNEKCTGVPDA